MTMLERVKVANRITTTAYDAELTDMIEEACADLKLKGITGASAAEGDPNIRRAIVLYCSIHHGQRDDRDILQKSYDNLKGTLGMSSGYTDWEAGRGC